MLCRFPCAASAVQRQEWQAVDSSNTGTAVATTSSQQHLMPSPGHERELGKPPTTLEAMMVNNGPVGGTQTETDNSGRGVTESSAQSYGGRSDSLDIIDNSSSTVSGTSVTEEGWESGEGSNAPPGLSLASRDAGREVGGLRYGNASPRAAAAPSKRNSLRRVLDSARCVYRCGSEECTEQT